jgi:hypothetical protein
VTLHTATLHPQLAGLGCRWWRDRNLTEEFRIVLGAEESADFLSSPIRDSVLHGTVARFRLAQGQGRDHALLEQIREGGGTDFLALPLFRLLDHHLVTTWVTDTPGGFTDDQIARLSDLVPARWVRWSRRASSAALPATCCESACKFGRRSGVKVASRLTSGLALDPGHGGVAELRQGMQLPAWRLAGRHF